jgi:hypothetical protein
MVDEQETKGKEALQSSNIGSNIPNSPSEFREETASEIASPITNQSSNYKEETASEFDSNRPKVVSLDKEDRETKKKASVSNRSRENDREETAAEIAAPVPFIRDRERVDTDGETRAMGGTGLGTIALALSILSLFVMPILFGVAGVILGFVARRRGAEGLGAWAIGIGAVSIIVGIFILPFF